MSDLFSIQGKVALITGAGRGMGFDLVTRFSAAGAVVFFTVRTTEDLNRVADECQVSATHGIVADLATAEGIQAVVDAMTDKTAYLDILINNAGTHSISSNLAETKYDDWAYMMQVNAAAGFELSKLLLPLLTVKATGDNPSRIVNISSNLPMYSSAFNSFPYAASKAAMHQVTKNLCNELTPLFVTVNAIAPHLYPSRMLDCYRDKDGDLSAVVAMNPLKRMAKADDIMGTVQWLCSRGGAFVSGAVIPLDGGSVLR